MNDLIYETVDANLYVYTIQLLTSNNNVHNINAYFRLLSAKVLSSNFDCLKITTRAKHIENTIDLLIPVKYTTTRYNKTSKIDNLLYTE